MPCLPVKRNFITIRGVRVKNQIEPFDFLLCNFFYNAHFVRYFNKFHFMLFRVHFVLPSIILYFWAGKKRIFDESRIFNILS